MDRILITGGNGNLGRLLAERFEARGIDVISFDLPGTDGSGRAVNIEGDVCDTDLLQQVVAEHAPGGVIHLASLLSGSSEADPMRAWAVNATASIRLMTLAQEQVSGPFLFASTVATYGPGVPMHLPLDAPQWPRNVYGATKVAVERMGNWMRQTRGLDFRCLRFPMVLSPFAPPGALTAYPCQAFHAGARGEPFAFPVSAGAGMSTLYLDDVTRSIEMLALADGARLSEPAYNLHAFHFTASQLAEALAATYPDAEFTFAPDARVEAMIRNAPDTMDSAAALRDWDWEPTFDFEASIDAMKRLLDGGSG